MGGGGINLQKVWDVTAKGETPQVPLQAAPKDPNAEINASAIDAQKKQLDDAKRAQGMSANILTSPQGATAPPPVSRRMLLGS